MSRNPGLTGALPSEWAGMKSLKSLLAADCGLSGAISAAFPAAWRQISEILMPGNALSGSLPGGWAPSLYSVDLQFNQLSGALPEKLGSPRTLLLGGNAFASSIPPAWGSDMRRLEVLNLE